MNAKDRVNEKRQPEEEKNTLKVRVETMKTIDTAEIQKLRSEWQRSGSYSLPIHTWHASWQRAYDVALAGVILLLSAPFLAVGALLIKLTSRGPVIYTQTRLGQYGRPFTIFKLRTMVHNCEALTGPCWAKSKDARVTWAGRILRVLHIDELPQLWNVLIGDMSLVGPRPERPELLPRLEKAVPHYRKRLLAKPGITGLSQVLLPADTHLSDVSEKLPYDLYYIRHANPWLDLRIVLATVLYLLRAPIPLRRSVLLLASDDSGSRSIVYMMYRMNLLYSCRDRVCA